MDSKVLATMKLANDVLGLGDRRKKPPKEAFTIKDFVTFSGMTESGAYSALKQKVEREEIKSSRFFVGGRWAVFYWL